MISHSERALPIEAASLKRQRRAHGRTHLASIFLACGCSVYQPGLLSDQLGSSGSSAAAAGNTGAGGRNDEGGTANSSAASGGTGNGGAASGGTDSGDAGDSSTAAGTDTAGHGGATTCMPETPTEFCVRVGKNCGTVDGTDNCGSPVVGASCGSCSDFKRCGGGGEDNVCGALTDPTLGGMATASSQLVTHENASKAFDLDTNTKWFTDGNTTGWIAYQFPETISQVVRSYSVTSANDIPQRDPADWQLQGSNDGAVWVTIDERSAEVFASRHQTKSYTSSNSTAYPWYRLLVTANSGASALQLAELVLYAN